MRVLMSEALPYDGEIRVGSHDIARQFVKNGHSVFWLGCAWHLVGLWRGVLGDPAHRHVVDGRRSGPVEVEPGLWAYHPVSALPFRNRPGFRGAAVLRNSLRFTTPPLAKILDARRFLEPDLLWLSQSPNSSSVIDMVRPGKIAYRISDRYDRFRETPPSAVAAEKELLRRADRIFATARDLLEELPPGLRSKSTYLPNGVDFAHFHSPAVATPEPDEYREIPRPRAVFAGTIGEWVDIDRIAHAARKLSGVRFVLIGPVRTVIEQLRPLSNVTILGPRDYAVLPPYIHHAHVGLIPFRKEPLTDSANCVKLLQYFAAGLPVVSTRLDEIESLRSPAILADSDERFATAVEEAIAGVGDRDRFVSFAKANTWDSRYEIIRRALAE